ncbi:Longin-like domain-containing protein [Catenaria anguillulae PL171]|uniref:Synaptobrevin homolog YKT6 n=1 Tax=Catenaria anguillulae PL171 TaxID=765915 RepID=A0A1Y2HHQ9_9FUNG|nr:Longin-like domain-containing protein [Catenaria anguillulae PL171]ORZ34137.1 Longin-like domain-containing protein [Catenaria anguillulae PL171]
MKIYAILLLTANSRPADIRAAEYELSQFGFFQRGSVQEFMNFTSQTLAERTQAGQRQSVEQDSYLIHCFVRPGDKLAAVIITDQEYPLRVSFTILSKCIDDFAAKFPADTWSTLTPSTASAQFPVLRETLNKYQDPHAADNLMRVQRELDETKVILHKTIESVLEREEKLDSLVERSNALSTSTRAFYKTAKKNNQCCSLM